LYKISHNTQIFYKYFAEKQLLLSTGLSWIGRSKLVFSTFIHLLITFLNQSFKNKRQVWLVCLNWNK
jgi:hypothetical protein